MEDPTIATYACPDCQAPITRHSGVFVTGVCDACGRKVEFEFPPNVIEGLTDDPIEARKSEAAADQDFEARKVFAAAIEAADYKT